MRYCPICWTERRIQHGIANIHYWWKYKVKKEPEPSYEEIIAEMIPTLFASAVTIGLTNELLKAFERGKNKNEKDVGKRETDMRDVHECDPRCQKEK